MTQTFTVTGTFCMLHNGDSQLIIHGFIYISQTLCYHSWKENNAIYN
jgi:hypothetical protein